MKNQNQLKKTNELLLKILFVALFIGVGTGLVLIHIYDGSPVTDPPRKHADITGQILGWAKLVTTPARVIIPSEGPQAMYLSQVKCEMSGGKDTTALVDTQHLFPRDGYKVGDEVLIATIPGETCDAVTGSQPGVTYIVIDYCKHGDSQTTFGVKR